MVAARRNEEAEGCSMMNDESNRDSRAEQPHGTRSSTANGGHACAQGKKEREKEVKRGREGGRGGREGREEREERQEEKETERKPRRMVKRHLQ